MEIGEKVFVITDKVVPDRGLKLCEGKILAIKPNGLDLDDISVDFGKRLGIHTFREDELYYTAKDTLNFAYAKNLYEQNKLSEQLQDIMRIEAELKLKEKGETK